MPVETETTQILIDFGNGDRSAADRLLPLVYDELRALAARYMQQERPDHTLQPTAVVHEAYLRLVDQSRVDWKNRSQFVAIASRMIRRILVDHARKQLTIKRGGARKRVPLTEAAEAGGSRPVDLLNLDEALEHLGELNERHRDVVEMRFFGGLTETEIAHALGVSPRTVHLDWRVARMWLRRQLEDHSGKDPDLRMQVP